MAASRSDRLAETCKVQSGWSVPGGLIEAFLREREGLQYVAASGLPVKNAAFCFALEKTRNARRVTQTATVVRLSTLFTHWHPFAESQRQNRHRLVSQEAALTAHNPQGDFGKEQLYPSPIGHASSSNSVPLVVKSNFSPILV